MTKTEKFIEVLQTFNDPVTIATWAKRIVELYPVVLNQINSNTNEKMTLREFVARISVKVSKGEFPNIEIENCEPYRKVKYCSESMKNERIQKNLNKDIELIVLDEHRQKDLSKLNESDRYRIEEFTSITDQLNRYFNLNFELHHVLSLTNRQKIGKHHADNLQLLTSEHALQKKDDEVRFTIDEQKAYIKRVIVVHTMVSKHLDINLTDEVLDMLLDRLAKVY
ncbi:hypothetical protein KKC13_12585 [bacterium]|nr:hypothetical protein [bacterium]MBU1959508.1 hypothetical protein [bacterium]